MIALQPVALCKWTT